jgi:hypothetical protein
MNKKGCLPGHNPVKAAFFLVIQQRFNLIGVKVGFIIPVEAGVDVFLDLFTFDGHDGSFDGPVSDADRILRDGPCHFAAADSIDLLLAGIITDDDDFAVFL